MGVKILALTSLMLIAGLAVLKGEDRTPKFEPAAAISTVEAVYPPNVVNPGTVVLEVTVGPSGEIENVKVVREGPGFTSEALRVIRQWKFRPAKLDGQPIRSVIPVAFSFSQPLVSWPRSTK